MPGGPCRIKCAGNIRTAKGQIGRARSQLDILERSMAFQSLKQGIRRVRLDDGTEVECNICFGLQQIHIYSPPLPIVEEEIPVGGENKFLLVKIWDKHNLSTPGYFILWDLINNKMAEGIPSSAGGGNVTFPCSESDIEHWRDDIATRISQSIEETAFRPQDITNVSYPFGPQTPFHDYHNNPEAPFCTDGWVTIQNSNGYVKANPSLANNWDTIMHGEEVNVCKDWMGYYVHKDETVFNKHDYCLLGGADYYVMPKWEGSNNYKHLVIEHNTAVERVAQTTRDCPDDAVFIYPFMGQKMKGVGSTISPMGPMVIDNSLIDDLSGGYISSVCASLKSASLSSAPAYNTSLPLVGPWGSLAGPLNGYHRWAFDQDPYMSKPFNSISEGVVLPSDMAYTFQKMKSRYESDYPSFQIFLYYCGYQTYHYSQMADGSYTEDVGDWKSKVHIQFRLKESNFFGDSVYDEVTHQEDLELAIQSLFNQHYGDYVWAKMGIEVYLTGSGG